MSSNLPLVRRSRRVLPWSGGLKLEINIPSQRIRAKWKGGLINEGGIISSEYGISKQLNVAAYLCGVHEPFPQLQEETVQVQLLVNTHDFTCKLVSFPNQ